MTAARLLSADGAHDSFLRHFAASMPHASFAYYSMMMNADELLAISRASFGRFALAMMRGITLAITSICFLEWAYATMICRRMRASLLLAPAIFFHAFMADAASRHASLNMIYAFFCYFLAAAGKERGQPGLPESAI